MWAFYAGSVLAIAALSATAFLWPFCLYWSWLRKRDLRASLRPLLPLLPVVALELVGIVALTPRENSTWRAIDQLTEGDPFGFFLGMGRLLLWLFSRLLTTAHWLPIPVYELGSWELYAGAAVLAGLGAVIYRSPPPISLWSIWILLSVLPFLPVNDTLVLGRPEGPSRYLYPATAGTSLLLAWGLEEGSRRLGSWRRYLYGVLLAAILVSSWFSLKQAEAVSLYASGRNYVARGDHATGVAQLKRAIRQGPDAIDLESAYARVCFLTIGDRTHRYFLRQALDAYPTHPLLNLLWPVVRSMDADSTIAAPAWNRLKLLRDSSPGTRIELAPEVWELASDAKRNVAAAYHNVGTGFKTEGDLDRAVRAYTRSLMFRPERVQTRQALSELITISWVVRSMDADSTIATPAWNRLKLVRDSSPGTRMELAPEVWVSASEAKSDLAAAYHKAGNEFRMKGDTDRAVRAFTRSLMFSPDRIQTRQILSELADRRSP